MKIKICLCGLLLSQSVPAALIDFNDIAVGTEVSSLNPYDAAMISTRLWVTERETGAVAAESFTRGVIDIPPYLNETPGVVMRAGPADAPGSFGDFRWNIDIAVSFQAPVTTFAVDAFSLTYSTDIICSGINDAGEAFTLSAQTGGFQLDYARLSFTAPTGGYITGFHFSQFENTGGILLAMDNLDYTTVALAGASGLAASTVPEAIGLPTFAFSICAVLFAHRRMKAARK